MTSPSNDEFRVLYVNPFPALGGAEHSLLTLLETLPAGISAHLVTSAEGDLSSRAHELGVPVTCLPFPGFLKRREAAESRARLRQLLTRGEFHLVHGNSPRGAYFAGRAAAGLDLPVIWHLRVHLGSGLRTSLLRKHSTHRIAASRSLLREARLRPDDPEQRIIPNAVRDGAFLDAPRPPRPEGRRPVIGMLGRIEPLKGQSEFVQAALTLLGSGVEAEFVLGGGVLGPREGRPLERARRYAQRLEDRVAAAGAADRVRFVGPIDDPMAFLDGLDILVVPSHMEGFGRVVIEGMARGIPVVASEVGGIPEILETGRTGWLVPPRNPGSLVDACEHLVTHAGDSDQLARRGWEHAREQYTASQVTRQIVDFYGEICDREFPEPALPTGDRGTPRDEESSCTSLSI